MLTLNDSSGSRFNFYLSHSCAILWLFKCFLNLCSACVCPYRCLHSIVDLTYIVQKHGYIRHSHMCVLVQGMEDGSRSAFLLSLLRPVNIRQVYLYKVHCFVQFKCETSLMVWTYMKQETLQHVIKACYPTLAFPGSHVTCRVRLLHITTGHILSKTLYKQRQVLSNVCAHCSCSKHLSRYSRCCFITSGSKIGNLHHHSPIRFLCCRISQMRWIQRGNTLRSGRKW